MLGRGAGRGIWRILVFMPPSLVINACKNALAPYLGARALRRGCCGMDSSVTATLRTLERIARLLNEAGRPSCAPRVLELGPGRTPELLAATILLGADDGIGIDVEVQVPVDATIALRYTHLAHALCDPEYGSVLRLFGTTAHEVRTRFERFRGGHLPLRFHAYDGATLPMADNAADLIVSKSVLEHVHVSQVAPLLRDMRRVLAADGTMVHLIDLRDHLHIYGDDQVHGDWLEALSLSSKRFQLMFSRRTSYINRLRSCEWAAALGSSGLTAIAWQERRFPLVAGFDARALKPPWCDFSEAELSIGQVDVAACQDAIPSS